MFTQLSYEVEHEGEFVVQAYARCDRSYNLQLEENVGKIKSITEMYREGLTPEDVLNLVLEGLDPVILDKVEVGFLDVFAPRIELRRHLSQWVKRRLLRGLREDHEAEVTCQFCNKKYHYDE